MTNKERATVKIPVTFSGMLRALDGRCLHRHGHRHFTFPYLCMTCGLEKSEVVNQDWLERVLSALSLQTLAVGRRKPYESTMVALDMD